MHILAGLRDCGLCFNGVNGGKTTAMTIAMMTITKAPREILTICVKYKCFRIDDGKFFFSLNRENVIRTNAVNYEYIVQYIITRKQWVLYIETSVQFVITLVR